MLKKLFRIYDAYDPIFVKNCTICKALVSTNHGFCFECWQKLEFIGDPKCKRCSKPFPTSGHLMLDCECASQRLLFDSAYSVVKYNDISKILITKLKNNHNTYTARAVSKLIDARLGGHLEGIDVVCPVPLFFRKLQKRGHNQVAIILEKMDSVKGRIVMDLIKKVRETAPQSSLSKKMRAENLNSVFVANPKRIDKIYNKSIALFDDVMTTGITANECTKALLEAGAHEVKVFTFARAIM